MEENSNEGANNNSGRINGRNSTYRSGKKRIKYKLECEIRKTIKENGDRAATSQKRVGYETRAKRTAVILGFFSTLKSLGFNIESVRNLKQKHLIAVFHYLEEMNQSSSTIQNKISIMRIFCEWIGKPNMVGPSSSYVKNPKNAKRSTAAREDKSWTGNGIDVMEKIKEITKKDPVCGIWTEFALAFGLRLREAIMLRPSIAHQGPVLHIREGTKGGRSRIIVVETEYQRDVLNRAKLLEDKKTGFLSKRGKTLLQKIRHFQYVLRSCGISLSESGVTLHGLRHQFSHAQYRNLTGLEPPVRGGKSIACDENVPGRIQLMEELGHSRISISTAYYGSNRNSKPDKGI